MFFHPRGPLPRGGWLKRGSGKRFLFSAFHKKPDGLDFGGRKGFHLRRSAYHVYTHIECVAYINRAANIDPFSIDIFHPGMKVDIAFGIDI